MSNAKQATRKVKGGILAAIIATVIALLTVGVGVAFGAEGASDLVNNTIGDFVGGVTNAVKGGQTLLKAGSTKGGDDEKGEDSKGYDGFTIYKIWDDGHNQGGTRAHDVRVVLYRKNENDPWAEGDFVDEMYLTQDNAVQPEYYNLGGESLKIEGLDGATSDDGSSFQKDVSGLDAWMGKFEGSYPMYDEGTGDSYTYYVEETNNPHGYSQTYYMNKEMGIFYVVNTALHVNVGKVNEFTNEYLPGAMLMMEGGGKTWEWTSGEGPETLWGLNADDMYTIMETSTPVGYLGSSDLICFTLNDDGTFDRCDARTRQDHIDATGAYEDVLLIENRPFSVDVSLGVSKVIDGRPWTSSDSFQFNLSPVGNAPAPSQNSTVTLTSGRQEREFGKINITAAGTYNYTIQESIPSGATLVRDGIYRLGNLLYDCSEHSATIVVDDNGTADISYDGGQSLWSANKPKLTVTNTYSPVGTAEIHGTKTLNGRALQDGEFTFGLYEGNSLVATATNDENGDFTLVANYEGLSSVGTHNYVVREVIPNTPAAGMAYDNAEFPVSVGVSEVNYALECAVSGAASFTNTYTPTGSLSVSKTVAGDGADTSQQFAFTVVLDPQVSGNYGDMNFVEGTASFSLSDGQTITATNIPAGTAYAVSESPVENYTPSFSGESGTIAADQTSSAAFTNTYTAPQAPIVPETSAITVNRIDDTDGLDVTAMLLAESVPDETPVSSLDLSALQMTITPGGAIVTPTADTDTNALVYNFDLANGQTANVDLIVGSNVQVVNRTSSVSLAKKAGDGEASDQTFTVGTAPSNSSLSLTVGAAQNSQPSNPSQGGDRAKGWIQVNKVINDGATYDAFKVFDADVVNDNGTYKGTHLTWADDAVLQAVRSFLTSYDEDGITGSDYDAWLVSKYDLGSDPVTYDMRDNPQNAAEFIAIKIADSDEDTTAATTPKTTKGDTFASRLATVLRNYGIEPTVVIPANTATETDQGYYIVATTTSTIENGEAGTAPIWAPVPATGYVVDEKVSVPTFNKQVRDNTDDTTNFNKVADASTGQWLEFRLTTTLPLNLKAYPHYPLTISDLLPDGMDGTIATSSGYSVKLDGEDVTSKVDSSLSGNTLTITVADVLDSTTLGVEADGGSVLTVNYKAKLNANSTKGATGNDNTATLTYPADPLVPSTTGTLTSSAKVLTYQIKVDKVDAATRLDVDGAKFIAQTTIDGTAYWVAQDGSLSEHAEDRGEWTTENGAFTISGIDEGTYTITEIEAPNLYEMLSNPLVVVLDATKDYAGGSLTSLAATASGTDTELVSNPNANQDGVVGTVLADGTAEVRISNQKQIVLPITGLPVKTAGIIAGVIIAVASVIAAIAGRRREEDED